MFSLNPWEMLLPTKALYAACVEPVCKKYGLARTELDILLFLANNPNYDTAASIVEIRYLTKSHVSTSIRTLEERSFLIKRPDSESARICHLTLTGAAEDPVADGRQAQKKFLAVLEEGISEEEHQTMERCLKRMYENIHAYLGDGKI